MAVLETIEQRSDSRPSRIVSQLGEIPSDLPSAYDFVRGQFGAASFIHQELSTDYLKNTDTWNDEVHAPVDKDWTYILLEFYMGQYKETNPDMSWENTYEILINECAKGWIREQSISNDTSVLSAIGMFSDALTLHLQEAETSVWAVEWLTSRRPIGKTQSIGSQEDRTLGPLWQYWKAFDAKEISGSQFYLNAAGDFLINLIRLKTPPEMYARWTKTADAFMPNPPMQTVVAGGGKIDQFDR